MLTLDVQEALLLARELRTLCLDRPHEIQVQGRVELGVVLGDPAHDGPATLISVSPFHELGVDALEVVRVPAGDPSLLLDDLPGRVENDLEIPLLSGCLIA